MKDNESVGNKLIHGYLHSLKLDWDDDHKLEHLADLCRELRTEPHEWYELEIFKGTDCSIECELFEIKDDCFKSNILDFSAMFDYYYVYIRITCDELK